MEIADSDGHRYADAYPCRLPVWWARTGEPGPHIEQEGVTGMLIILRIEKRFNRFERILAKVMRAPREVRRPLDRMNSMLWELCDGSRSFQEVCSAMDATFNEDIAPPVDRTASGIDALKSRNLMTFLSEPFTKNGRYRLEILQSIKLWPRQMNDVGMISNQGQKVNVPEL